MCDIVFIYRYAAGASLWRAVCKFDSDPQPISIEDRDLYIYIHTHTHKVVSREQKCRTHRQERSNAAISSADGLVTQRGAVGQTVRVILAQQLLTPTNTTARLFYTNDDEHVRVGPAPLYGDSMWLNVRYVTHRNKVNFRRIPARLL